jgi:hypothetical protein
MTTKIVRRPQPATPAVSSAVHLELTAAHGSLHRHALLAIEELSAPWDLRPIPAAHLL